MLGKNNQKLYDQQHADQHQHWALRKLSLGVASVLVSVSIYAGASTISANADAQTSGATETTALTNGFSASSLGSASSVSLNAQSASSATTNKSAANNASATATSAVASSVTNEVASATTSNSAQSQSATSEKVNSSATQQNRSASQAATSSSTQGTTAFPVFNMLVLKAATSSSTQGTTADYTPKVTTSLPSDYPRQFNNDTYSEYFVFKEVKDELNDVSYYGAVKQDGSESGTVYIFAQSVDGTISSPIKLASGESKSQNGITFNNYGDTYTVYESNRNNNNLYYGYSSDGEKDSADRSQGYNLITGVLPTNGQFALTINYYDKAGNLVSTKSDPQTVLAGKYFEVSAPKVVNGYVYDLNKTEGNQSGEVSEYTNDKVGQTWTRHFTYVGLDGEYTLNSDGSFTVKVYKNSQLVKTMTVPVDGTGRYKEINGRYLNTYDFPNPYIAESNSLTYNYIQVGSIVPVDKDGNKIGDEVPYTNDSDDPSKVESNEPVPSIPGYHISTDQPNTDVDVDNGTVTPSDPTKDTEVVYVKDDTTETETKNVTRTINYVDKTTGKTVADSVTQTVTLTRTKTTNGETGKVTYSNWTIDGSWAEQTSPDLSSKGYDAPVFADGSDASKVAAATVNENSNDTTVTVYYPQHSDTTNETKTVKRTIEYLDKKTGEAIPSRLAQPVEQDVTLTRTVDTNKVTGEVTYGDWTVESGSWGEVVSPDLTNYGYTAPDKESVAAETVDGNTENSDVKVYYDHATTTVTPEDPKDPNTPINPNDPNGPKYTEDQTDVTRDAKQTVHYTGAGDKTPSDKVQTQKNAFTRTVTIDKVTGKTISTTPWTGSKTFGTETTPVVDGYHADKKVAGGLTATPENPNVEDTVTYAANGKIIPVDPNGNKIPDAPTPTYPTDPTDPTKVVPDEPVPDIPGYTPETPRVTPENPGKDTNVPYTKNLTTPTEDKSSFKVVYVDQDSNNAVLETKGLSGKYGDQITYTTADTIKSLEDKGYVLVSDGFTGKAGSEFSDSNNGKTYLVVLKHGTTTVTPEDPKDPNTPINPNDPNGPKYTEDQTDVTRDAKQTVHYTGAGDKTPSDKVQTQKNAFTRTVTIDKVTGKTISTTPWTGSKTFGTETTPVVDGYHADKKVAGGLTATPENPNVEDTVTYAANGKIIPVDPNGNKIPDAPTPTYPTDPTDPTKVVPDEPVPDIPGYTPETPRVTPENPGKDTNVPYTKNPTTPTEDKSSFKVVYVDQDSNNAVLETKGLSGKYGDQITYTTADTIKSLEDKGYVLVSDGFTGKAGSEFSDSNNGKTYLVVLKHGTTTVTPEDPKDPNTPINPNDPNGPKYTEDQTDVTRDAKQTVHYTGAGDKTPSDKVQTQKNAFTRTVTIDKVTGKTISTTPWTGSKTFGTETTPVVDGYHADKKVAGGLTATPENPNVEDTVTYAANGKIIPVDPNGNKIPDAPTPTYPTDPTDPTKVVPDEPVPDIPGYTPETPRVTPENPGKDTNVPYTKNLTTPTEDKSSFKVVYVDQDSNNAVLETKGLSGKYGDQITYTTADTIKSLEDKGYVLVSDGFTGKAGSEFSDSNNGKTYLVVLKHGTTTVTPEDPKDPNTPINPNDPNGPKYTEDQTDVTRDAKQTVHYTGAGDKTPSDKVQTQKNAFTRTVTIDKVTGKTISTTPWTGSKTFGTETTPVVDGYHADKKVAGGLTATPENPNVEDTVTYAANGKIIPVDPNGNKIPDAPTPTYPTDPTDPTKVVPDEPVPDIPGYTPETPRVTPENPGKDTNVPYTKNPTTPTEDKSSFKVVYVDQDSNNAVLETKGLSGKYGDQITYTTADTIKSLEDKGYVLVSDGFTGKAGSEFSDSNNGKTYLVVLKHGTTTVTPEDPKDPNTPINPNDPNGPKYTEDQTDVTRDAKQTVHYTGAGDKTPSDKVQTQKNAFTRTVTIDKVTGKTISTTPWTGSKTFGTETTPVVDGYHADKKVAGGLTATPENPNVEDTVTYAANGKIIPVDPNGNKIPDAPTPTYPTDPTDPTKVVPDEPVPDIPGYTPETPRVTPENPGKDTNVPYTKNPTTPTEDKSSFKVVYVDQDSNNAVLETKGLSGKYGDQITYTTADTIKSLEDKGYVLVSDGFTGKAGSEFSDSNNGKTYLVVLKHGTTTVTPEDPKDPNTPINPNDPNGPKYTEDQTDVTRDATQTITYHYSDGSQPDTQTTSTEKNAFTRTVTVDKVTGKTISTTPWTGSHTFGKVNTPVIQGYHADKKTAGGLTATPDHPDVTDQVVYTPNGKIIPVDPNGNKIPNVPTPTYPTDPTDPTKVVPDEPVPTIPGYTPETPTVTPEDPGADTPVVYHTPMTPTPEKPTTPTTPGSAVPQAPTSGATPASPTAASTSQAPAKKLPQTGDQSATGLVAAGLATLLGLMGTGLKRRKQER